MTRIAVGGFLHETNTFAPTKATYDDFVHGGGWPAMAQGADVLKTMRDINVGLAGFVEQAETRGWEMPALPRECHRSGSADRRARSDGHRLALAPCLPLAGR